MNDKNEVKQNKKLIENRNKQKKNKRAFFFVLTEFQKNIKNTSNLSEYELGCLLILSSYQRFRDSTQTKSYIHYKGKRASNSDLTEILRIEEKDMWNLKTKLKQKGVLNQDQYGIYFNDTITFRGKKAKELKEYSIIYVESVRKIYNILVTDKLDKKEKTKQIKNVGLLLSILPFVSKKSNILVDENGDNLTINKLKEVLGLGRNHKLLERIGEINIKFKEQTGDYLILNFNPTGINGISYKRNDTGMLISPHFSFTSIKEDKEKVIDKFNLIKSNIRE